MKIIKNIPGVTMLAVSLLKVKKYQKQIIKAREAGDIEKERELIHFIESKWAPGVIDMYHMNMTVVNEELLPKEGPVVYISNHQSYLDIVAIMGIVKHATGFVAKDSLEKAPLIGPWVKILRGCFIKRGDARESLKSINEAIANIEDGYSMVIFPEGTRSRCDEMAELKAGAFKLATKPRVPIVPITISKTYTAFEEKGFIVPGVSFTVTIHEPIETKDIPRAELADLPAKVDAIIRNSL